MLVFQGENINNRQEEEERLQKREEERTLLEKLKAQAAKKKLADQLGSKRYTRQFYDKMSFTFAKKLHNTTL